MVAILDSSGDRAAIYQQKEPLTLRHNLVWICQHQQQLDEVFPDKETSYKYRSYKYLVT